MNIKFFLAFLTSGIFISGCSLNQASQEAKEVSVQEEWMTPFEDLKHEMHCIKMDLQLLENRLETQGALSEKEKLNQEELKKEFHDLFLKMENKVLDLEKKEAKLTQDILHLSTHMNEASVSINGTQDQMKNLSDRIEEILKLQGSLQGVIQTLKKDEVKNHQKSYVVQAGDSLEKIAKKFQISLEDLRKENRIEGDKIFAGQELVIPQLRW